MVEAVRASHLRGIEHIYLSCHLRNRPMQRIAEKFAAAMRFEDGECFARVTLRWEPTAAYWHVGASSGPPSTGMVVIDL
jgi:hypothetical protein